MQIGHAVLQLYSFTERLHCGQSEISASEFSGVIQEPSHIEQEFSPSHLQSVMLLISKAGLSE